MTTLRVRAWALTILLMATSSAGAQSTADALKLVPASADGFALVSKIGELDKKAVALAQKLNLPPASLFDLAKTMVGIDEGIDRNGSAVAMVFLPTAEPPAVVVGIPVTNFDAVLKAVNGKNSGDGVHEFQAAGMDALIAKKGNFALLAQSDCREFLDKVIKGEPGIVEKIKPFERWLTTQDVAGVVLERTVRETAKKAFDTIPEDFPGIPPEQAAMIKIQLQAVKNFAKESSEQLTHVAVGISADADSNVKVAVNIGFVKGESFSKWGAAQPKESPLAGLPSGGYIVALGSTLTGESMQKLMTFSASSTKTTYDLSDDQVKELEKLWIGATKGIRSVAMGFQPPTTPALFDGLVSVMRVDSSKEYLKTYKDVMEKQNKLLKIETSMKSVKVGKLDGVETVMDLKSAMKGKDDPTTAVMLEKMFGPGEKVTTTLVAVNPNTVLMGYVPAAKMKGISESYAKLPMLTSAPLVLKTLKLFPEHSFMVALINPKGIMDFTSKTAKELLGKELPIPAIGDTPPVGIAAASDATSFQLVIAAPGDVVGEIGKMVQKLKMP